ncbi:MAG: hypothetical protein ACI8RE_001507 [Ilumatobacter sp.]|jgi:hypothetical protein
MVDLARPDSPISPTGSAGARWMMLGGAHQVILYTVGAAHTLLRRTVATEGDGQGDHTGLIADSGARSQVNALGAGRR